MMNMNLMAQMTWGQWFLGVPLFLVSILLILVVLIQRGRGTGLAGAFGGAGSSAFGAKTGDVLTWITCGFAAVFFLLAVVANHAFDYSVERGAKAKTKEEPQTTESTTPTEGTPITVTPDADGTINIPAGAVKSDGSSTIQIKLPGTDSTQEPPQPASGETPPAGGQEQGTAPSTAPAGTPSGPGEANPPPPVDKPSPNPGSEEGGSQKGSEDKPSP